MSESAEVRLARVEEKIDSLSADTAEIKLLLVKREDECKDCKREIWGRINTLESFMYKVAGAIAAVSVAAPVVITNWLNGGS